MEKVQKNDFTRRTCRDREACNWNYSKTKHHGDQTCSYSLVYFGIYESVHQFHDQYVICCKFTLFYFLWILLCGALSLLWQICVLLCVAKNVIKGLFKSSFYLVWETLRYVIMPHPQFLWSLNSEKKTKFCHLFAFKKWKASTILQCRHLQFH